VPRYLLIVKLVLSLGLVAVLLWFVDWRESLAHLAGASAGWIALALLVNVSALALSAWRWRALLGLITPGIPFVAALRYYWIGAFFSSMLPSSVGGDAVRLALARRAGGTGPVAASILVERATGLAVLVALAAGSALAAPNLVRGDWLAATAGVAFLVLALAAAVLLAARSRVASTVASWLPRAAAAKVGKALAELTAALTAYRRERRALVATCLVSVAYNGFLALFQYLTIRAVGGQMDLSVALLVTPLVMLIHGLPVTIAGIGLSEGAFVVLYGYAGLAPEIALAAALLRRLLVTLVALVGGALWAAPADTGSRPARTAGEEQRQSLGDQY